MAHDNLGHNGTHRTYIVLKRLYYWKGLKPSVTKHIQRYMYGCFSFCLVICKWIFFSRTEHLIVLDEHFLTPGRSHDRSQAKACLTAN